MRVSDPTLMTTAELSSPQIYSSLMTLTHSSCFASLSLASAEGGCDYSRKCHMGVIQSELGMAPVPCWQSVHGLFQPSGSFTPLGPTAFIVTLEIYLAAVARSSKLWNVLGQQPLWRSGSESQHFPLMIFSWCMKAFILFCMLERGR